MSPSANPNQFPQSSSNPEQAQATEPLVVRRPNPPRSAPTAKSEPTATGESKTTRELTPPKSPSTLKSEPKATDEPKNTGEPTLPKSPSTPKSEATPKSVVVGKSEPKKGEQTPAVESPGTPTANADTTAADITTTAEQDNQNSTRPQPIPPPSEPLQYRAIGLVRGKYLPSEEQFTRGNVLVADGKQIDAVLLGRVMSLVKNHLDLANEHLWVVYPRTRQEQGDLHVQIVGVWEPEKLDKERLATESEAGTQTEAQAAPDSAQQAEDGYFSIRGEVVFQSLDQQKIIVKIKQAPKKDIDKPKFFKLTLNGVLDKKAVGYFWDFQVVRDADSLVIQQAKEIQSVRQRNPGKPRLGGKRMGGGSGPGGKKPWKKDRPHRPGSPEGASAPSGGPSKPLPKPIPRPKRQPSSEGSS